jgi:3-hydroxyisobutyrate dehydrogenase
MQICTGKKGVFENAKPNTLFLDCSSIDVESSRKLHINAKSHGVTMFDAPVSGGVAAATAGTLTFMVGGDEKNFAHADSILKAMGKKIIYAGNDTAGVAAKICNNMLLGISMIGVCEAFVLAEKLGLDPKKLFEISSNASGQCWSLTSYCPSPHILPSVPSSNDYKPGFSAKMMLKDLRLSQDAASLANTETPLGNHAMKLYEQFVALHQDEIDFSGIIKMLEK